MSVYLNRVTQNLKLAGISVLMFSQIADIPQATLQACMSGRLMMDGPTELRLYTTSVRVLEICEAVKPFMFERGNAASVKRLVDSDFTVEEIRSIVGQLFNVGGVTEEAGRDS